MPNEISVMFKQKNRSKKPPQLKDGFLYWSYLFTSELNLARVAGPNTPSTSKP